MPFGPLPPAPSANSRSPWPEPSLPDSPERLAGLFAKAGTAIGPLLRSPAHRLLSNQLMVLDHTGGRTGHHYSFPIGHFTWEKGEVLAFSSRRWPLVLRTARDIHLLIKGQSHEATSDVVSSHEHKTQLLAEFVRQKGPRLAKRLMLGLPGDRKPSVAELETAADKTTIVRFHLAP
jgi:hypothetical protein